MLRLARVCVVESCICIQFVAQVQARHCLPCANRTRETMRRHIGALLRWLLSLLNRHSQQSSSRRNWVSRGTVSWDTTVVTYPMKRSLPLLIVAKQKEIPWGYQSSHTCWKSVFWRSRAKTLFTMSK